MRRVSIAICTSGEPVSPSLLPYSLMIWALVAWSSAMISLCELASSSPRTRGVEQARETVTGTRRPQRVTDFAAQTSVGLPQGRASRVHVTGDLIDQVV